MNLLPLIAAAALSHPLGTMWTVSNSNDSGQGSLRDCVIQARAGDVITLDPSLFMVPIHLTSGSILIDKNITIRGLGQDQTVVDRGTTSRFRIFDIQAGNVILSDMTIANGYADGGFGGGIANRTNLVLLHCRITDNISDAGDGGGGIWNSGYLTLQNCVIDQNQAIHSVGFPVGYGGGIKSLGTLNMDRTTVTKNIAAISGGGIYCNGMLNLRESTVENNEAPEGANIFGCVAHFVVTRK